MNKIETNQLDRIKLLDLFAEAWRKLDAEIIIPYLASDFEYCSHLVYSSLDRQEYIDYMRVRFKAVREGNLQIIVKKGYNELGESAVIIKPVGAKEMIYVTIEEVEDGVV